MQVNCLKQEALHFLFWILRAGSSPLTAQPASRGWIYLSTLNKSGPCLSRACLNLTSTKVIIFFFEPCKRKPTCKTEGKGIIPKLKLCQTLNMSSHSLSLSSSRPRSENEPMTSCCPNQPASWEPALLGSVWEGKALARLNCSLSPRCMPFMGFGGPEGKGERRRWREHEESWRDEEEGERKEGKEKTEKRRAGCGSSSFFYYCGWHGEEGVTDICWNSQSLNTRRELFLSYPLSLGADFRQISPAKSGEWVLISKNSQD